MYNRHGFTCSWAKEYLFIYLLATQYTLQAKQIHNKEQQLKKV